MQLMQLGISNKYCRSFRIFDFDFHHTVQQNNTFLPQIMYFKFDLLSNFNLNKPDVRRMFFAKFTSQMFKFVKIILTAIQIFPKINLSWFYFMIENSLIQLWYILSLRVQICTQFYSISSTFPDMMYSFRQLTDKLIFFN